MTTLTNQITIAAPRGAVWQALTDLDLLDQYDPGVRSSQLVGEQAGGLGAQRRCDLRPAGWFIERVAVWRPKEALAFELVACSFPVSSLRHDYTLTQAADHTGARTVVTQVNDLRPEVRPGRQGAGRRCHAPPVGPRDQRVPPRSAAARASPARRSHAGVGPRWPTTPIWPTGSAPP